MLQTKNLQKKRISTLQKKTVEHKEPESKHLICHSKTVGNKQNRTRKEKRSDRNYRNFAKLELRSQFLTYSAFMLSWLVMTWSLTMAGLSRAGKISEPRHYKQKVQEMKYLSRTWVLKGNSLKIQTKKNTSRLDQTNPSNTCPPNARNDDGPCNQEEIK